MKNIVNKIVDNKIYVKYILVLLVPLFYLLVIFDRVVYGTDGKGYQYRKYRTDHNGVQYSKPKGLINIFKKWQKVKYGGIGDLDITSMYPSIINLDKPLRVR